MYYHSEPLKYVEYDKIFPHEDKEDWLYPAYKWLGFYCGYCPQVWLSRSTSVITGFRSSNFMKKRKQIVQSRRQAKIHNDQILFGFENVKGFAVDMDMWSLIINTVINVNSSATKAEFDKALVKSFDQYVKWAKEENYYDEDIHTREWDELRDLELYLSKYLFIETDQVVVPSLNLKAAKKIICRNEKQKKKLRKMGFIEDRIIIKNIRNDTF